MSLSPQQIQCLLDSPYGISGAVKIKWMQKRNQNILLIGERHPDRPCDGLLSSETKDFCRNDGPYPNDLLHIIIQWVKQRFCTLLFECPQEYQYEPDAVESTHHGLFTIHQNLSNYPNVIYFDNRSEFMVPNRHYGLAQFFLRIWDRTPELFPDEQKRLLTCLKDVTLGSLFDENTLLNQYLNRLKQKANALSFIDPMIPLVAERDIDTMIAYGQRTMTKQEPFEILQGYELFGAHIVDWNAFLPIVEHPEIDYIIFGGEDHVDNQAEVLRQFGFQLMGSREKIGGPDQNCIS